MNKILLSFCLVITSTAVSFAQCDPSAYDWLGATFGVSPNPTLGENFVVGTLGQPYSDVIYVLAPSDGGDVDPLYTGVAVDSIRLDSVTVFNGIADVQLSNIGLNVTCNNNGDSPDPCMFLPGEPYCGQISGTPTVAGTYDVKIWIKAYTAFLDVPYSFEGYTLVIVDPNSVAEHTQSTLIVKQNSPNPAIMYTNISYELARNEDVSVHVMNLVGETVFNRVIKGRKGDNTFRLETASFESGIYLYSIQTGDKKITRKMIVQQ